MDEVDTRRFPRELEQLAKGALLLLAVLRLVRERCSDLCCCRRWCFLHLFFEPLVKFGCRLDAPTRVPSKDSSALRLSPFW